MIKSVRNKREDQSTPWQIQDGRISLKGKLYPISTSIERKEVSSSDLLNAAKARGLHDEHRNGNNKVCLDGTYAGYLAHGEEYRRSGIACRFTFHRNSDHKLII